MYCVIYPMINLNTLVCINYYLNLNFIYNLNLNICVSVIISLEKVILAVFSSMKKFSVLNASQYCVEKRTNKLRHIKLYIAYCRTLQKFDHCHSLINTNVILKCLTSIPAKYNKFSLD